MGGTPGLPPTVSQTRRALRRAQRGVALDSTEIEALLYARGDELAELREIAGKVREQALASRGQEGVITYSPKVFIPLTHLCRDRCHYCTFATSPAKLRERGQDMFADADQVLEVARAGQQAGCLEALFTLGDRPEARWPAAAEWLAARGYDSTLSYLRAMAILVIEETGLLPHLNPGVMTWEELARLRPVAPSMGLMLETTSTRIFDTPGLAHYGSPDKDPAVRLRTISDAGRQAIPFTTGLLLGIGETATETADGLLALRRLALEFGHIQEVIIQNFRAKPGTAMARRADLDSQAYFAAVATARLVLPTKVALQAPPNLTDLVELGELLACGIDDWGGVSPVTSDFVNPERAWPDITKLEQICATGGFALRARLTTHPSYVRGEQWIDSRMQSHVNALRDDHGLARPRIRAVGSPWQTPTGYADFVARTDRGRTDLHVEIDESGRSADRRSDFGNVYGDWAQVQVRQGAAQGVPVTGDFLAAMAVAENDPAALADPANERHALTLMNADRQELAALARLADQVRADTVGSDVTYVVNRNLNFTNVCYTGCRFCAFAQRKTDADAFTLSQEQIAERVSDAWASGATEICMQGGIHPDLPGTAYFDLARTVKRACPSIHLHAFSPMEIINGASRSDMSVADFLATAKGAGVDSIPGTAAEILDDEIRWILTKGKLPAAQWIEVVKAAHRVGLPSSSTMMYGHVDEPIHWVRHLRVLRGIQDETGGFTEFVGLPFVHHNAPLYLAGVARAGSTHREDVAVTAMSRLMLHGAIDNIQVSWVKLGTSGCADLLNAGANDVGGTLMEETISRMAGSEFGSALTVSELAQIAQLAGRPARERTTTYGPAPTRLPLVEVAAP